MENPNERRDISNTEYEEKRKKYVTKQTSACRIPAPKRKCRSNPWNVFHFAKTVTPTGNQKQNRKYGKKPDDGSGKNA